jgi:uncharacterized protein YlxW (UPF0749 family)
MKKHIESIGWFLLCILIVSLIITGFRKAEAEKINLEKKREEEIKLEKISLKQNIDELKLSIINKKEQFSSLEDSKENKSLRNTMEKQLQVVKELSGYSDLVGPGIYISITDNQSNHIVGETVMSDIVHDSDILSIINDLKVAGAEAISINGERVLSTTGINCGGPVILVNQESLTAPFVIKAIGDPKLLYAAVTAKGTTAYILKNVYELSLFVRTSEYILVPRYAHKLREEYINVLEGGE